MTKLRARAQWTRDHRRHGRHQHHHRAQIAARATANATALHIEYVIFAGQIIDFHRPTPAWHACRDPLVELRGCAERPAISCG
jgi:hypothetical protein